VCLTGVAVHDDCTRAAILWVHEGRFDTRPFGRIVRVLAPVCYLCGAADTEHVEHVRPLARGGIDSWGNVAGACQRCNLVKGARLLTLTDDQSARLAVQQAAFRAAHRRVTPDFAIESLAIRALSPSPHKNSRIAQGRVLRVMCEVLFDAGLIPVAQGAGWLERALTLVHERGWLARVPDWPVEQAVADYIDRRREEERNDQCDDEFIDWRVRLDQLRRTGRDDEALEILMELIAESEAVARNGGLPTAEWTQRAVVISRRRGDRDTEIELLRRYVAVCPPGHGSKTLFDRLAKLCHEPQALAVGSRNGSRVVVSAADDHE
jgi:hypothetical protein